MADRAGEQPALCRSDASTGDAGLPATVYSGVTLLRNGTARARHYTGALETGLSRVWCCKVLLLVLFAKSLKSLGVVGVVVLWE